jgi:hypothetical protein
VIGLIVVASQLLLLAATVTGYVGKRDDVGLKAGGSGKDGSQPNYGCVRSLEALPRNQSTRRTFSSGGLSGVGTMSIREELREVAWLASVIAALSMLGVALAVALAAV